MWWGIMQNLQNFHLETPEERVSEKMVYCRYPMRSYKKTFARAMLLLNVVLILSTVFAFMFYLEEISARGWLVGTFLVLGAALILISIRYFGPRSASKYGSWDFGITTLSIGNMLVVLGVIALIALTML